MMRGDPGDRGRFAGRPGANPIERGMIIAGWFRATGVKYNLFRRAHSLSCLQVPQPEME